LLACIYLPTLACDTISARNVIGRPESFRRQAEFFVRPTSDIPKSNIRAAVRFSFDATKIFHRWLQPMTSMNRAINSRPNCSLLIPLTSTRHAVCTTQLDTCTRLRARTLASDLWIVKFPSCRHTCPLLTSSQVSTCLLRTRAARIPFRIIVD
jgi:hypothetical protein